MTAAPLIVSLDALTLRSIAANGDQLRFVASRRQWFIRTSGGWRPDTTREVFWHARRTCIEAAASSTSAPIVRALLSAGTRAAIVHLAAHDRRLRIATVADLPVIVSEARRSAIDAIPRAGGDGATKETRP